MKANELRIGNYVMFFKDAPSKVIGFANGQLYIHYNDEKYFITDLDDASPIPLTEEWLLKLGFSLYKELVYIFKYNARIKITKQFELLLDGNLWVKLEHVHQLQNLYFALTNEELTIK